MQVRRGRGWRCRRPNDSVDGDAAEGVPGHDAPPEPSDGGRGLKPVDFGVGQQGAFVDGGVYEGMALQHAVVAASATIGGFVGFLAGGASPVLDADRAVGPAS